MNLGIEAIAGYVPERRDSNYELKAKFEVDDQFIENKIGVLAKARKALTEDTSDMCVKAFDKLSKSGVSIHDIECIAVCTQNPDGHGLPHVSAIVHDKLDAREQCAAFDIGLGCSGYVYSLSIVRAFMQANGMRRGLLFSCDPYSKIVDPAHKSTYMLFGDAATATFISDTPVYAPTRFAFGTRGKSRGFLQREGDRLEMNGREIFNFSMTAVPPQIAKLIGDEGITLGDVDLFALHQGSRFVVEMLGRRLGVDQARVPVSLAQYGNTVSSSIPLILMDAMSLPTHRIIVISGFGVGLSWASAILRRV